MITPDDIKFSIFSTCGMPDVFTLRAEILIAENREVAISKVVDKFSFDQAMQVRKDYEDSMKLSILRHIYGPDYTPGRGRMRVIFEPQTG